ncbi:response regulator [Rhodoferax fermentans]|uniref:Response regulatory domain-containing protein n=1 Tax=Rhodoferax fermentans TaxID=28066 RepID=A0A1T1AP31_RHOFE|nr:response regulator transcription factor [Rhodoferax fermentans]MBK1685559.1 hypothetical protein [Rhodoferax fermentans]OOV05678.1 hypothetical protein RF819_02220 [Rhodoferax fermentans]
MTLQILLVDDNLTFLASVKKSLRLISNTSVLAEAHDGVQALALAQQLQPDLVLLDIVMSGLSGLEVAKAMQVWPRAPQVLFLSMHDNESYRLAAESLGSLGLVSKSNFVSELLPILAGLAASPKGVSS